MWSGKFMARAGIEGYDILLTGDTRIPADDAGERKNKGVESTLKLLNKKAYNEIILEQEDTVSFHIAEEAKVKANKYGDSARQVWVKSQEFFIQPQGLPRQDYARNLQSANYMTQQETPRNGSLSSKYLEDIYGS